MLKSAMILGLLMARVSLFAEEQGPFVTPSTNLFTTNSTAQERRAKYREEAPREFGIFSPMHTQTPGSFGNGQPAPGIQPMFRPPVALPEKDNSADKKRDWIFATPNDTSAESIFKVKGFGAKDKDKENEKSQSGFAKFVAGESNPTQKQPGERDGRNSPESRFGNKEDNRPDARLTPGDARQSDTVRDFNSRNLSSRQGDLENRANVGNTKSSIFGEFFGGNRLAQDRWAEQSMARRNEFQQLFESRGGLDANKALTPANPTVVVAPTDFTRSPQGGASDPWKTDANNFSKSRSFADEVNRRQSEVGTSSSFATPTTSRREYSPATLPFPKRPGDLFK